MSRFQFNARAAALLALAASLVGVSARADVIILKDGFTIHAVKTVKEKGIIEDPVVGPIVSPKANGMTAADDGPRWVVFSTSTQQLGDVGSENRFKDFATFTRQFSKGDNVLPTTAISPVDVKPWDYKTWSKEVKYDDSSDKRIFHKVEYHISVIGPYYLRVGSTTHRVGRYFMTKEWDPEIIRRFLVNHPDLVEKDGKPDAGRREKLIRFWIQGDFLDDADKEIDRLLKDLPAEKDRCARLKSEVNTLRAEKQMVEIEQAHEAGRHQWAIAALDALPKAYPKADVPRAVNMRVAALRAEYETRTKQFDEARGFLDALMKQRPAAGNNWLVEAAGAVRQEMHLDTLGRLEMFVTLADRADKDAKAGRKPTQSADELLAAAVTGWHLGKVAAETKPETAYRVWEARKFALEYLRTPALNTRLTLMKDYLAKPTAIKYDELEKLVSLLPPPDAPAIPTMGTVAGQLPRSTKTPEGVNFLLRLPDEYQPGRSYPLLILLPDPDDLDKKPPASPMQIMLERFGDLPTKLGYIVAVPQWWDPANPLYRYTKEEQGTVTALVQHLRRAYQVDSDRIFLWGNGEGGSLALDMGGAHPDMFAGVVPFNPSVFQTLYIPCEYWVNFFQQPVYLVMGDQFGPSVRAIRMMSERWMPRGFPALVVSYKGRSKEWFPAELPYAFDWMGRKRRADPGKRVGPPELGFAKEGFSSSRFSDNRFYWLSTEEIKPDRVLTANLAKERAAPSPAKFTAKITNGNTIEGKVFGVRQLTVWFGKGMVDYTKPVTVSIATDKMTLKDKKLITPEIPVLMEDLYERADRQRPYFARIDFAKVP